MPVRRTGAQTGGVHTGGSYAQYVAGPLARIAASQGIAAPLPSPHDPAEISQTPPVRTVLLHEDRWVVQCPDCARDYSFVCPETPLYMCSACWNAGAGGLYCRVEMPDGWERVDVAAGHAPDPRRRNWAPRGAGISGAAVEQTVEEVLMEFGGPADPEPRRIVEKRPRKLRRNR